MEKRAFAYPRLFSIARQQGPFFAIAIDVLRESPENGSAAGISELCLGSTDELTSSW